MMVTLMTTFTVPMPVVTVNTPCVDPAGMLIEAGTDAYPGSLEESWIVQPPAGAGSLRVTVPCEEVPFGTEAGDRDRLAIVMESTVKPVDLLVTESFPVRVAT